MIIISNIDRNIRFVISERELLTINVRKINNNLYLKRVTLISITVFSLVALQEEKPNI